MNTYSISEVISALSYALDLSEGLPMGHSMRTCMIGMRIARTLDLPVPLQADLYYALLMKDSGCSSNASRMSQILGADEIDAKRMTKTEDWTHTSLHQIGYLLRHAHAEKPLVGRLRAIWQMKRDVNVSARELISMRCERGASIALRMGLSPATAEAIYYLDEHWDGAGYPDGLVGDEIPLLARIMNLAQNLEVFHAESGPAAAIRMARGRKGKWFDPELVSAAVALDRSGDLWRSLDDPQAHALVAQMEPEHQTLPGDDATIDNLCVTFADVIDAKSPFTYTHSTSVSQVAIAMANHLGMTEEEVKTIRRAALLHDVGKLSVPNTILEKEGDLSADEWNTVARHPFYTHQIVNRIPGFGEIAEIAAAHHEKLDGSGYYRGLSGTDLSLSARILTVADIFDALTTDRPYHTATAKEEVLSILTRQAPQKLDPICVEALSACVNAGMEALPASSWVQSFASAPAGVPIRSGGGIRPSMLGAVA